MGQFPSEFPQFWFYFYFFVNWYKGDFIIFHPVVIKKGNALVVLFLV